MDCVDGLIFGLENSNDLINVFNLGSDSSTNVNKIAHLIIEEMGLKNVKCTFTGGDRGWKGDVPQVRYNCEKINKLGWKPKYDSDGAVKKAIKEVLHDNQ